MSTKNIVVVGYDGSEHGVDALKAATEHAELYNGEVRVVIAYSEPPASYSDGMFGITDVNTEVLEAAKKAGEALCEEAIEKVKEFSKVPVTAEAVLGRPSQALIDASEDAKLLVVGAHGNGAWRRFLLGSTSTEIIHNAEIPVLVVR
ncbi:MAG: universal stress protein [Micrococcaceae bacterium]